MSESVMIKQLATALRKIKNQAKGATRADAMEVLMDIEHAVDHALAILKPVVDTREKPSKRQQDILDFLRVFHAKNGYMPNHRELCDAMGIKLNPLQGHLEMLQRRGHLTWTKGKARTFVILEPGQAPALTPTTA